MKWPKISLGEVFSYRNEFTQINDFEKYKRCRVQLHARGIVLRDVVSGAEIKTKKQQRCKSGDFLVAEIDAKVGGFGIVPEELESAIVSSHYFLFRIDETQLDKRFLGYYIRTPFFRDQVAAQGSTNYAAIRPKDVLEYTIPLPPLSEQKRIVARIEEVSVKIGEARELRQKAVNEVAATWHAYLKSIIENGLKKGWNLIPVAEVAEINPPRGKITVYSNDLEVSFVPMSTVDDVTGRITKAETRQLGEVKKGYTFFTDGDVIFARITPCMQNGKSAIAKGLKNGIGFGSTEFHVMRPTSKILAQWLHALVRHKDFKDDAAAHFKGTAGQQRVPQSFLESKKIPVPSMSEQHRIVEYLDSLQSKVDELKKLQAETQKELNALMPSILDKAFKGEL